LRVRNGKEKPIYGETLPDFQKVGVYTPASLELAVLEF